MWQQKAVGYDQEIKEVEKKLIEQSTVKVLPKGLGVLTAALLEAEIMDWHRFKNRRQVASYSGLCPSENSSGEKRKQGSINKHGNERIRQYLIEAVWRLEIWHPDY